MKSAHSSKTLVTFYRTALLLIAEDNNLCRQCCNNPKFYVKIPVLAGDSNWYKMPLDSGGKGMDHVSQGMHWPFAFPYLCVLYPCPPLGTALYR
jgi:hypothetical protein